MYAHPPTACQVYYIQSFGGKQEGEIELYYKYNDEMNKKEGDVMAKKYYISDCHFGHENVIQFDKRPFASAEEMDFVMIESFSIISVL